MYFTPLEEAYLTIELETHYSKDEILEGYLNTINYGGVFGIENASFYYFGKSASDLTLAEASILAGIPKSPNNYEPIGNTLNAKKRQLVVLESMVKNKIITKEEAKIAYNTNLNYEITNNSNFILILSIVLPIVVSYFFNKFNSEREFHHRIKGKTRVEWIESMRKVISEFYESLNNNSKL